MKRGFTLIEMSIVLIIIALILSGVLVGRSMMANAEARIIMSEIGGYTTAFKEFTDKYYAIPGDMNNAETYWQSDDSCPSTATNSTVKVATCNGDGNGVIGDWTNTVNSGDQYEWFRAWQHLANAEFIEGRFTGVSGATSTTVTLGTNVPASKTGNGGWTLLHMVNNSTNAFYSSAVASHTLIYGGTTSGSFTDTPNLPASSIQQIDTKMDDGFAASGNIRAKNNSGDTYIPAPTNACFSSATSAYKVSSTAISCQLIFLMGV